MAYVYEKFDVRDITFVVAADPANGKVLIDFGRRLDSLDMTAMEASGLSQLLLDKAREALGLQGGK